MRNRIATPESEDTLGTLALKITNENIGTRSSADLMISRRYYKMRNESYTTGSRLY
jgi:hypothetical protein